MSNELVTFEGGAVVALSAEERARLEGDLRAAKAANTHRNYEREQAAWAR